ncbi:MAG TPA: sigma-70 family RNA polymerase sigma factor [Patescibacteria group bacterium]|jgi:RNA polymerase sigma factor (sigma-70 family)|nr:sigma-70 family RNA polymerase sigma factor [Patescibacteria group bacterium]
MQETPETPLPTAWEDFLDAYADEIFRVVRLFADSYDDRMDLFLFVCDRLRDDGMRRVRSFRHRPEAPCRFTTYLGVVCKNLAVDYLRARDGRFRHFRNVEQRDEADRLIFEYHLRDGRSLEESRGLLRDRHGIRLGSEEVSQRAARLETSLSASQRWRLLSRLFSRRRPMSIDSVTDTASGAGMEPGGGIPLPGEWGDPEGSLRSIEAQKTLHAALESLPPRQRLALVLRYRDGLTAPDVGCTINTTSIEAERLAREGLEVVREALRRCRVARPDLESAGLASCWPDRGGAEA